jgi:cell division protein FtsA
VVTGGGSQLKHITQLVEYLTGMDTRIGYPNEHLASGNSDEITSPIYATGVGLVIKGLQSAEKRQVNNDNKVKGHSTKSKGSFFDAILKKGREIFEDDTE